MAASPYAAGKLAAYNSASTHGGVAAADPHRLIVMLMDGALERIAAARGCMDRKDVGTKSQLINRVVQIIGELHASLDLSSGREIATNMSALYDYMVVRLLKASAENNGKMLDEVSDLLQQLRNAWVAIPPQSRAKPGVTP